MSRMTTFGVKGFVVALVVGFILTTGAQGLMTVTKQISGLDPNGYFVNGVTTQITVTVTIDYDGAEGTVTALGYEEVIPSGFTYAGGLSGPNPPAVTPNVGQSGTLGFAYIFVPSFPASFTYTLNCPESICDPVQLVGKALYRTTGSQLESAPVANVIQLEPTSLTFTRTLGGPGITGSSNNFYIPGQDVYVTITIQKEGPQEITALGFQDTLPNNWTYQGLLAGPTNPAIEPAVGTTDLVEFAYIDIPDLPVSFTYVVHVPDGYSGSVVIGGDKVIGSETKASAVVYRTCGGPILSPKVESPLEGAVPCLLVTRTFPNGNYYIPGQDVVVQINIRIDPDHPCSGIVTALGYQETIPSGWVYQSVSGPNPPAITPTNPYGPILDFGYIYVPDLSGAGATFTYTIRASETSSGPQQFQGRALYRVGASGELKSDWAISEIIDDLPPVITLIGDEEITIECGEEYQDPGATATDIPDGDLTEQIQVTNNVDPQVPGDYTVVYSVTDSANHTSTVERIVHVRDTQKPVITLRGDDPLLVECKGDFVDPGADVIDTCDTEIQVQVSGSVNTNVVGDYLLTYTATDSSGNPADPVERLVIVRDTTPPEITLLGSNPLIVQCGQSYFEPGATAVDSCAGSLTVNIDSSQVNTNQPGTYIVDYSATDPSGNTGTNHRTVIVQDTIPPIITINGPNPMTVQCGSLFVDPGATATDLCDGNVPVQSTGSVDTSQVGQYQITYTATDSSGNSDQAIRIVNVVDTLPPTITLNQSELEIECCGVFLDPGAVANDQCDGLVNLLASAYEVYVIDQVYGGSWEIVDEIDTCAIGTEYRAKYEYTDVQGNQATPVYMPIIIVDTTPPVITLAQDEMLLECGTEFEDPGATAVDSCDDTAQVLTLSAIYRASDMYEVESIDTSVVGEEYVVRYVAEDTSGNRAEKDMLVRVVDTTGPEVTLIGENPLVIECGGVFEDPGATAEDVCDGMQQIVTASLIYEASTMYVVGTVDTTNTGEYILVYSAMDSQGNTSEPVTRVVKIEDTTPPVVTLNGPDTVELNQDDEYVELGATAVDVCAGELDVVIEGTVNTSVPGTYILTYRATDPSGNVGQATRTVIVKEIIPEGEGIVEGEGTVEGTPEGTVEGTPEGTVEGEGEVQPGRNFVIVPSPTLDFGTLEIKKIYKQRILLVNKGTADAKVYMLVKDTGNGVFELEVDDTTIPVKAGSTEYVEVYFKPVKVGSYVGKVLFVVADDTAPAEERYVTLLGEGKKPKRRILGCSCGESTASGNYTGDVVFIMLTLGALLLVARRRRVEE